ncbi:signal peptidase II [Pseudoclavibacter helvolus]|uniref:signal peptidase II n=1 Tax=Pseudoclavibacter helvolus TaxID=255205 RepID=UPI0024AC9ABD|nr:signal peptidase II [Pseudoclavibacter helvolus]
MPSPSSDHPEGATLRRSWGAFLATAAVAAVVAGADQLSKAIALDQLSETERIPLLGNALGLQLAFNPGSAFSLGENSTWLFTIFSALVAVGILFVARRITTTRWAVAVGLIWGGAVGNLLDRLFADPGFGRGYVTDFLAYGNVFIGNLADIALVVGMILGVLFTVTRRDEVEHAQQSATATDGQQAT